MRPWVRAQAKCNKLCPCSSLSSLVGADSGPSADAGSSKTCNWLLVWIFSGSDISTPESWSVGVFVLLSLENDVKYFAKNSIGSSGLLLAISVNPFMRGSPRAGNLLLKFKKNWFINYWIITCC